MHTTKKLIVMTAIKTLVLLVLIALLVAIAFSLSKPKQAGDFFYTVGLKDISARTTLRHAHQSKEIEDYYTTLVRAYDAHSHKIAAHAATALIDNGNTDSLFTTTEYDTFVKSVDTKLSTTTGSTNQYIKMVFAYSQMRVNKGVDESGALWNRIKQYCKGTGLYYYYNSVCPITGYINAIIDSNSNNDATIFRVLLQMKEMDEDESSSGYPYWRTTKDNTMESVNNNYVDAQVYMLEDIKNLFEAKSITLERANAYAATQINGSKYVEAFNYWKFLMA